MPNQLTHAQANPGHSSYVLLNTLLSSSSRIYYNSQWATNQHRDTIASHIGHYDQLSYYAVAQNESIGRVKYDMLQVKRGQRFDKLSYYACICISWLMSYPLFVFPFLWRNPCHQKMYQPCGPYVELFWIPILLLHLLSFTNFQYHDTPPSAFVTTVIVWSVSAEHRWKKKSRKYILSRNMKPRCHSLFCKG